MVVLNQSGNATQHLDDTIATNHSKLHRTFFDLLSVTQSFCFGSCSDIVSTSAVGDHHSLRTFVTRVDCIRYEHDRGRSSLERLQPSSGGYLILADRFDA